jgi:hypothetical protein
LVINQFIFFIYQGVPMLRSWQALPLAGKAVHQRLQSEIDKTGTAKQGEMDFVKFDTLGKSIDTLPQK